MDLSTEFLCVDSDVMRSCESKARTSSMCDEYMVDRVRARNFLSSIASPAARISAAQMERTVLVGAPREEVEGRSCPYVANEEAGNVG